MNAPRKTATASLLIALLAGCAADSIGPNGQSRTLSSDSALRSLKDDLHKNAVAILKEVFGDHYDDHLADVVAYFPLNEDPGPAVLVTANQEVRILDREAVVWAVVLAEPNANYECPTVGIRLTAIGETRPDLALSLDQLLTTALSRKAQDKTPIDPKEEVLSTDHVVHSNDTSLCVGWQRFSLQKDTINRMSIRAPIGKEDKTTKVEIANQPVRLHLDCVSSGQDCKPPTAEPQEPDRVCSEESEAARQKKRVAQQDAVNKKDDEEGFPTKAAIVNFANSRIPRYAASVALGTDLYNISDEASCQLHGGCRPGVYVFGHIVQMQFGGPRKWTAAPWGTLALVLGARLVDPVLGEGVLGARFGIEEGLSKAMARFGVIVGVAYSFRTFDKSNTTVTTTTETMTGGVDTKTAVVTSDQEAVGDNWRLFAGFDFAF